MRSTTSSFLKSALILNTALILTACGGSGGGGGGSSTPSANVTSITPLGMVQSASPRAISLTGNNFANGMTISATDSVGGGYTVSNIQVLSANVMTASVTIPTAPADRYVTITVKSSSGTTLASTVLGVASASKTLSADIQPNIFDVYCVSCHDNTNSLVLNAGVQATAAALINTSSTGCPSRLRVTPGDPRRSKSVLIDKILVHSTGVNACAGLGMPADTNILTAQQLSDIIDWVAGGAY